MQLLPPLDVDRVRAGQSHIGIDERDTPVRHPAVSTQVAIGFLH